MLFVVVAMCVICAVGGESFDGKAHYNTRSFVAPGEEELKQLQEDEIPTLAEYNYDSEVQRLLLTGYQQDLLMWTFQRESQVTSSMTAACRKCMIAGNLDCVRTICQVHVDVTTSMARSRKIEPEQHRAFATGTAMYGDILCSLCKHTRDVMCTMKLCVDPERDQNIVDSGVECMQGFCRWQKETVVNTGFNNYYHAWWQPQNLYYFFDHVTKEIATAYNEFMTGTSRAISGLG